MNATQLINDLQNLLTQQRALVENESAAAQCGTARDRRRCQLAREEFEAAQDVFERKLEQMAVSY